MTDPPRGPARDLGFVVLFMLAVFLAIMAYMCRFHIFGFDLTGWLYWRTLTLLIVLVIVLIVKLIRSLKT